MGRPATLAALAALVAVVIVVALVALSRSSGVTPAPTLVASTSPPAATASSTPAGENPPPARAPAPTPAPPPGGAASFVYSFNTPGTLKEAPNATNSTSPYWFLDSGGEFIITDGVGETIQGALAENAPWRLTYASTNPLDTDNGYHPQNIFRLVTQKMWADASIEAQFLITNDNLSASPNRNESNGLLLMSRYQDADTLYYAGIRVDGTAVIKKKYQGTYYTMAQVQVFPGTYSRSGSPNLLPHQEWLGLRSEAVTNADGSVAVHLYLSRAGGPWELVASAVDRGQYGGTAPIVSSGAAGIRTDFMDVEFKDFRVEEL